MRLHPYPFIALAIAGLVAALGSWGVPKGLARSPVQSTASLAIGSVPAPAPRIAQASVWSNFVATQDGFSVLMPGTPTPMGGSFNLGNMPLQMQQYVAVQGKGDRPITYSVGWMEFPPTLKQELSNSNQFFQDYLKGLSSQVNGQLLQQGPLQLRGNPGRSFKLKTTLNQQPYILNHRIYLVGSRLYSISATVPQSMESSLAKSTAGFLQSFKLLK